ncbi:hypothetical protein AHAS_Ahas06G0145900 [Arachis hypogaea]
MGYFPPPQNDSSYYSNGGWKYYQETTDFEQSNQWGYANQDNSMEYYPTPQNNSCYYANVFDSSYPTYQEPSSLEQTFNSLIQNCPTSPPSFSFEDCSSLDYASTQSLLQDPYNSFHQPQNLFHNPQDSSHTTQNNFTTAPTYPETHSQPSSFELIAEDPLQKSRELLKRQEQLIEKQQQSWKEQEILLKEVDEHLEKGRKNLELLSKEDKDQLVDVKEELEERESKEDNQENPHSSEAEKCKEEKLMEPPMQKAFDKEITPTITQPPRLGFKEVKAINKSTKKRIVTKLQRTIFMKKRRSTTSNPPPDPASKLNQAINKRKLLEERSRQGAIAESFPPFRSFLLTN